MTSDPDREPSIPYWLSLITYQAPRLLNQPTHSFNAIVGFVMFEARDEDRNIFIRFAPDLAFLESICIALQGKSLKSLLMSARPGIERMVAEADGTEPLLLPQEFSISRELTFLPCIRHQTDNFSKAAEQHEKDSSLYLNSWSAKFEIRKRKDYGIQFLRKSLRNAFSRVWCRKELKKGISVVEFIPDVASLRSIFLAYAPSTFLFRLMHPISIVKSTKPAEVLASNWPKIQAGLQDKTGVSCEMRAVVESLTTENRVAVRARALLQDVGIAIDPVSSLEAMAKQAQIALCSR